GVVALIASWYPPGLWPILRHAPVVRVVALEYGVVLFVLFASMAAGPALPIFASRRRRKIGTALILAGALTVIAGIIPALPAARPALTRMARSGIAELRARGHLQQPPEVYEQRLAYYLAAAGATTVKRAAIPGALWLLAGVALVAPVRRRELLFAAAVIGELVAFGAGFNPAVAMTEFAPPPKAIAGIDREYLIAANFEVFPSNAGTVYRVRDAASYDVLMSKDRVEQLKRAGYNPLTHSFNPILTPSEKHALELLGVRSLIGRTGVEELPGAVRTPLPPNLPPTRIFSGLIVSLLALFASGVWLRLYTLAPPTRSLT